MDYLNNFKWFRRFKGGTWWQTGTGLTVNQWTNRRPNCHIYNTEDYSHTTKPLFPEKEFYQKIVNIPPNGLWRDEFNLAAFLAVARKLRQRGIDDGTIIDLLSTTSQVLRAESQTNLQTRVVSWTEIEALIDDL